MKNKIFIIFCLFGLQSVAQILGVDTLVKTGPLDKRINLVIMGDGYTTAQMAQFITDATTSSNYLLNTSPFLNYKKYFNVFAIKIASPQSGITHPGTATDVTEPASPVMTVTNNFNTRFDNYNVHRNIYAMNPGAVYATLASAFPAYDQVVILGNSTEYGGAGGAYAVSSINAASSEIVAHEMGHSFAGLADEYWAGPGYATEKPNMTSITNTAMPKWAPWLGSNSIGLYPYDTFAPASQWFRPHQNCKMQFLNVPYCSVCKQAIVEKIHSLVTPIDGYFPDTSSSVVGNVSSQWFKTKLVKPSPNTLKSSWQLNYNTIANNKDSVLIDNSAFSDGDNTMIFTVCDTTKLSRDTNHVNLHTYSLMWTISYSTVGIKEIRAKMELSIFPNPASEVVNLNYTLLEESEISISVIDMNGKVALSERYGKLPAGDYKKELNVSALKEGNYILALKLNNQVINNKFIIVK